MLYLWIAILSHLLFAVNSVIDKFLLNEKRIGHPASYAFAIGILSLVVLVLIPFGFFMPSFSNILLALTAGTLFTFALLFLFVTLKAGEASRVVPVVGGFVAFFTLVFAYFLVGERLGAGDLAAFAFLVLGMFLMARGSGGTQQAFRPRDYFTAILAAGFFGLSFVLTKIVFNQIGFISGLIWTRFGMAAGALLLLLYPESRQAIRGSFRRSSREQRLGWFVTGQAVGAVAGLAQNYAIALGSVSIVNALQGTQFAFLFVLTVILSLWYPAVLKEELARAIFIKKVIAIILISLGVAILALRL